MKTKFFWPITTCILLLTNSCNKALPEVEDYFAKITTVSATVQSDGTLLVTGTIETEGAGAIDYAGFCYNTQGNPQMLDNQVIATVSGNTFTVSYPCSDFSIDSVYYFRSWATNGYGYSYGNSITVDSIVAPAVTPPCSLTMNTVKINNSSPTYSYYDVTVPSNYMNEWEFEASASSGPTVTFTFGSGITTGIYTTTINNSPGAGQVHVSFIDGFISGSLNSGTSVYVNTIGPSVYDVSICNAPWNYNSSVLYFKTRLTVPY